MAITPSLAQGERDRAAAAAGLRRKGERRGCAARWSAGRRRGLRRALLALRLTAFCAFFSSEVTASLVNSTKCSCENVASNCSSWGSAASSCIKASSEWPLETALGSCCSLSSSMEARMAAQSASLLFAVSGSVTFSSGQPGKRGQ